MKLKPAKLDQAVRNLRASPESLKTLDEYIRELDTQRVFIVGVRNAMVHALGDAKAIAIPEAAPAAKRGGISVPDAIAHYRKSEAYRSLRYRTRKHYDNLISRILESLDGRSFGDLTRASIDELRERWATESGKTSEYGLTVMLRTLAKRCADDLEDEACQRLSGIFSTFDIKSEKAPLTPLTKDHVLLIIKKAHEEGRHSIALAQAFQSEFKLQQRDVIGEWVPQREPGISDIIARKQKWLRGLRWEEIDRESLVLRHTLSRNGKPITVHLSQSPLVMEELNRLRPWPTKGPIIIHESVGLPYKAMTFRYVWRQIADAAGLPKEVTSKGKKNVELVPRDDPIEAEAMVQR